MSTYLWVYSIAALWIFLRSQDLVVVPLSLALKKFAEIDANANLFNFFAFTTFADVRILVLLDLFVDLFLNFDFSNFFLNLGSEVPGNKFERSIFEVVKMNVWILLIKTFEIGFDRQT